ncbi:helicase domain protein [Nitzschia inconspicua]|uniref:Helicase domain protein n=1 Tax=Nitzschia inconspicua TaxID=303405 RepID=A0A9K3LL17_9STRA|nr:helicase domain protein [Nitzschia inconspicua]
MGVSSSLPKLLRILDEADHIITETNFEDEYQPFCTTTIENFNDLCVDTKSSTVSPSTFDFHRPYLPTIEVFEGATCTSPSSSVFNNHRLSNSTNCDSDAIDMNLLEPTPIGPHIKVVREVPASSFFLSPLCRRDRDRPYSSSTSSHDLQGVGTTTPMRLFQVAALTPIESMMSSPANISMNAGKYQNDQWKLRFQDLLEFQQLHGHLMVPNMYPKNKKLSQWVKRQRYQYRLKTRGHHSTLTDEREELLNQLGFVWNSHGASWNDQYQRLEAFYRAFGHIQVPSTGCAEYSSLSTWCKHQRREYRKMVQGSGRTTMTMERVRKLESICFDWNPRHLVGATAGPGPM